MTELLTSLENKTYEQTSKSQSILRSCLFFAGLCKCVLHLIYIGYTSNRKIMVFV